MSTETPKTYLEQAIEDDHAELTGEGKKERIRYIAADHSERWSDPEEKVRAEFWAELIYKYEYDPNRIKFEVRVPRRTPNDLADLVIYKDEECKDPYFVFEAKRSDASDAEFAQSIEQACGNRASLGAHFCGAIAGLTRRLLRFDKFPPGERERNHLTDIPKRYGKPPEWRFYKNKPGQDLSAVPREELRSAIRKCHQTLWEGGRRSPIAAFGEFCKIVFVKYRDEKNLDLEDEQPYAFQRRDGESSDELAKRILKLYATEQEREPGVFTDKINIDPPVLAQVVEHLEALSLDRTELDTKGVAFEEFMGGFFKGDFGQFFTPRELIAFSVEILNPERRHLVLDPACGSGGFLLYSLDHIRRKANSLYDSSSQQHYRYWHEFAEKNLFGIEINEELARVAKMNMIIHDDGHTNIVGHDALDFLTNLTAIKPELTPGKFDLILTNPPFGSVVRKAEKGDGYLDQFDLRRYLNKSTTDTEPDESAQGERDAKRGAKAVKARTSIKTEILFIERVWSYLKPRDGHAAIVLPDGILTNSSLQGVRDWMLSHFQILAVVSLPQFAFAYYDAGVKASIVFLRRLEDGETVPNDALIFMALAENIGYDATGRKTFNVTVEHEILGREKVERQSCDLFDYRVYFEWSTVNPKEPGWSERHREIIPDTGLVAQWREFQSDSTPFLSEPDELILSAFDISSLFTDTRKTYAICLSQMLRDKIDAYSNQPYFQKLFATIQNSQHRVETLGTIAKQIFSGTTPLAKGDAYVEPPDGIRFIRSGEITPEGGVTAISEVHIREEIHNGSMKRSQLQYGDLLIAIVGATIGAVGIYEFDEPANINQAIAAVRIQSHDVLTEYVCWYLQSGIGQRLLDYFKRPVARANINLTEISEIPIILPPREIQLNIIAEIQNRRDEVQRLRDEAKLVWRNAKQWFDDELLGSASL